MGVKKDCFAYRPGQKNPRRKAECGALNEMYCQYGECKFYKDKESAKRTRQDESPN